MSNEPVSWEQLKEIREADRAADEAREERFLGELRNVDKNVLKLAESMDKMVSQVSLQVNNQAIQIEDNRQIAQKQIDENKALISKTFNRIETAEDAIERIETEKKEFKDSQRKFKVGLAIAIVGFVLNVGWELIKK